MKILLGNNHLAKTGGTENYTFALALELKRQGHKVEYFTFEKGEISSLLEDNGIPFMSGNHYDLILANHNTVVEKLWTYGYLIQTCHGYIPLLEQPSPFANAHVSISEEVREHLLRNGYQSIVIPNGIDCNRFFPKKPVSKKLTTVLSLCQSDTANKFIRDCCKVCGIKFLQSNKHTDNVWSIEDLINQSDLVVGLGRSAYDAMACGRCVLVYDYRDYMGEFLGDGTLMPESINKSMQCNCSGRSGRYKYDVQDFIKEMQKYTPELAAWSREFALENLNIEKVARSYLNMVKTEQGMKDDCTALKMRLKEILQTIQEEKSDLREEHNLCANRMFDVQKQLMEQQTRCYEKSRKHLRAIRLLLWLCIILVITIVFLMLKM